MKNNLIKHLILTTVMVSGCSLDLKTKELAKVMLKEQSISLIDHYFSLSYIEDHEMLFGFLNYFSSSIRIPLTFLFTIPATMFGLYLIWKIRNKRYRFLLPFYIMIGGAYGNIVDRFLNGFVTEFFQLHYKHQYYFLIFNVADILVYIGIILIIIQAKDFQEIFEDIFKKNELQTE